jgi:hypothetical protein
MSRTKPACVSYFDASCAPTIRFPSPKILHPYTRTTGTLPPRAHRRIHLPSHHPPHNALSPPHPPPLPLLREDERDLPMPARPRQRLAIRLLDVVNNPGLSQATARLQEACTSLQATLPPKPPVAKFSHDTSSWHLASSTHLVPQSCPVDMVAVVLRIRMARTRGRGGLCGMLEGELSWVARAKRA